MANEIDRCPIDENYERLLKFAKNHRPNGGFSNMYVINKIDVDGNIIDEYYGMNMMTDYGMTQYFINKVNFPTSLYIGKGTGSFNYTTSALVESIPDVTFAATVSSSTKSYNYPMYYEPLYDDGSTGLITCMMKYMTCYFDYNITNITDAFTVTEYGLGTSTTALWTHSWVYDINGKKTYITKNLNERLEITVYLCYSYYENIITDGYANGRYTIITTMERFMNRMFEEGVYTYKRYNIKAKRSFNTRTNTKFEGNSITYTTPLTEFTMYNGTDETSGYFDGFCQWHSGFMTLEPQQLETPEDVDLINYYSMTPTSAYGFSQKFGHAEKNTPFTQIDITSVAMFNHKGTGDNRWTNYCDYHNNADHWYCETPMQTTFATPIYYSNNNTVVKMYVYQNIRIDDPIIELKSTTSTVYATNKYWDVSSWTYIADFKNIPETVRSARYWITTSNTELLNPVRASGEFHLLMKGTTNDGYATYNEFTNVYGARPQCDNYEYGWYMHDNIVYITNPNNRTKLTIGNAGAQSTESHTFGKWLITFNAKTTFYATDMSDTSVTPTPIEVTPNFTTLVDILGKCHRTETSTGLICLQSTTASEAVVIDMRGDTLSQSILQSKMATCVWGTNRIAYIPSDDTTKIRVYDYDTNSDISIEFTVPEGITSVTFMVAHTNYIWITDGSTYAYVFDIRDGSSTGCDNTIPISSNINRIRTTAVDDAMIIYDYGNASITNALYIRLDSPTTPSNMAPFDLDGNNNYIGQRTDFNLRYIQSNEDNTVKTLVLLIDRGYHSSSSYKNGSHNLVIDFGQFLYDGSVHYWRHVDNTLSNYILYGEYIIYQIKNRIPIMDYMPQRIIGKTKTIGTLNYIKNVSGKLWMTTFTNMPLFGTGESDGLPPGTRN